MKLIRLTTLLVCAASIISVSCIKDSLDNPSDAQVSGKTFDVVAISAGNPGTRTALAEDGKTVNWIWYDKFKGFLTADGATEVVDNDADYTVIDGNGNIKFKHSFTDKGASEYTYNVLYPAAAYRSGNDPASIIAAMPVDQSAPVGQMADNSDILIAKPMTLAAASADMVDVHFKRMSAMWKVNIKNLALAEGESILAVAIEVPGKRISGEFGLNLTEGTANYTAGTTGTYDYMVKVTLSTPLTDGSDFTVVLNSLPCTLAANSFLYVIVHTSAGPKTKIISTPALVLEAGQAANFSVDMRDDIAYGKSTTGCEGGAANLTIGTTGDYWQFAGDHTEHYAVIDLGAESSFDCVELTMDAEAYATRVTVLGSNNGTDFTPITDATGLTGETVKNPYSTIFPNMVVVPITFSQVSYRYVKLVFAEPSSAYAVALLKASVYNLSTSEGIGISSYTEKEGI